MKILVVGDSYMPAVVFERAFQSFAGKHQITYMQIDETARFTPSTPSESAIKEYIGCPADVAKAVVGHDAVVFHVAPITDEVLAAGAPRLKLVGCARGGPVNVDIAAATRRGVAVTMTPGKNAEAVADLTLAFALMLARGIPRACKFLLDGNKMGESVIEGTQFFGRDLGGLTLGLIGFGQVGRRVARRALAFGMKIKAFDPFVKPADLAAASVEALGFDELLAASDIVSLHARGNADNKGLIGRAALARMKPGALLINTARASLIDEDALTEALASGRLAGAALDIVERRPGGAPPPFLDHPNVIIAPHIGGSTHETVARGARMIADEIERFSRGEALAYQAVA